jgi:choline monooxygenase
VTFSSDDAHVSDDIASAESLPARAFTDRAWLERELATVFTRSWQLVPERLRDDDQRPLAEQIAARGTRVPVSLAGRPLYLQRGWDDDELRLFPNTCTHAWFPLVPGPSRGPTLVCGQHGRRFDCAGRFVSQQGFQGAKNFPRDCDHLRAMPAQVWRGLVMAALDPAAPALADVLAPVDESLVRFPDMARTMGTGEVREVAGNWKQHAWNFLDHFHIAFVHRAPGGLADAVDLGTYKTELFDHSVLQWVYASDPADGFDPALLPDRFADPKGRRVFALWWFIYPNLALNYYPWGLSVNVYQPIPERPDATRFGWYHWILDETRYRQRDQRWLSSQVDAEDVDALAQVSRGLRSGFAPRGRFAPTEEMAAHWLHRKISRDVSSATSDS